jgi:hypothetical protein
MRQRPGYRRFATAANATRFAVEDFPAMRALGAWMQVGDERYNCDDIRRLYEDSIAKLLWPPKREIFFRIKPHRWNFDSRNCSHRSTIAHFGPWTAHRPSFATHSGRSVH